MKKTIKKVTVVVLIFVMLLFTACTDGDFGETERKARERLELSLSKCLGTCLTREEMAQLIYNFEDVQENYSGQKINDSEESYPVLQLVTPGQHEHDENTRYEITILGEDEHGYKTGLKISIMDKDACGVAEDDNKKGDRWVLVDVQSETSNDVIKSDSSISFMGEGTEYVTQYENDFDSSYHAMMVFRCTIDEPPAELKPGDELTFHLRADVISEGEPITNAYMSCNMLVQNSFNPVSDTGANDSEEGIYAGGNTFTGMKFMKSMEDTVHITVPEKNDKNDEVFIEFYTSAGSTNWYYQWK